GNSAIGRRERSSLPAAEPYGTRGAISYSAHARSRHMHTNSRRSGETSRGFGLLVTWAALLGGMTIVSGCPTNKPSSLTVPLQLRTTQMPNGVVSFAQTP